jgi:hypothetical protein
MEGCTVSDSRGVRLRYKGEDEALPERWVETYPEAFFPPRNTKGR